MFVNNNSHFTANSVALAASTVLASAATEPTRDADGRFTGSGAFPAREPSVPVVFETIEASRTRLADALDRAVKRLAAFGPVDHAKGASVVVIRRARSSATVVGRS